MKLLSRLALVLTFSFILGLGLAASLLVYRAADRVGRSNHHLVQAAMPELSAIASLRAEIAEHERLAYELYAVIDADEFGPLLRQQRAVVNDQLDDLPHLGLSGERTRLVQDAWRAIIDKVDDLIRNIGAETTDWDLAREQLKFISDNRRMIDPILGKLAGRLQARAEVAEQRAQQDLGFMSRLVLIYTLVIGLIAVAIGWLLYRLVQSNENNRTLAQFPARNPMPVLKLDEHAGLRYANEAAHRFAREHLGGNAGAGALATRRVAERFRARDDQQRQGSIEERVGQRHVEYNWHWLPDRRVFHVYLRDITAEQAARQRLRRMAYEDDVTDLGNRRALGQALARMLEDGTDVCLALVGSERFHLLAPSVGFSGADAVLQQLGRDIRSTARVQLSEDVVVARLESAVFAMAWRVSGTDAGSPLTFERLLDAMPNVVRTAHVVFHPGWNMGVSRAGSQASAESIISDAGAALLAAEKRAGVRCLIHDESIREQEQRALIIEEKLREAIETGERGLRVHLQPQVALATGEIVGAEALLRWSDPELGEMSPGVFIPVAEQSGLIAQLGRWVTGTCLDMLVEWQDDERLESVRVGVNVAPEEMHDAGYAERIIDGLGRRGISPDRFEIEITERVLADSSLVASVDSLGRLSRAGVHIAIDDFGTGYSSLAYLVGMPITRIKIDKQFVDGLPPGEQPVLAPAIINLARELRMECLAEGVETAEQAEYLLQNGCELAQGYHYAAAMPREAFERLVRGA